LQMPSTGIPRLRLDDLGPSPVRSRAIAPQRR
jgi:hypothetical protein